MNSKNLSISYWNGYYVYVVRYGKYLGMEKNTNVTGFGKIRLIAGLVKIDFFPKHMQEWAFFTALI